MTEYKIGAGGWAYFKVPGLNSLETYSKAFNFVEVNSTFYLLPNLRMVESWRRRAPPDFEFSVRLNRKVTHTHKLEPNEESFKILDYTKQICKILNAKTIVIQTPETIEYSEEKIKAIKDLLGSLNLDGLRIAWEIRQREGKLPEAITNLMREHNIYQFSDEELKDISSKTEKKEYNKVTVSFHNVKMYKDAARYKTYKETEKFPSITRYRGLESLRTVLKEDSKFPSSKEALIKHQGWKLIDLTEEKRIQAKELLQKLEEKTYRDAEEVIRSLQLGKSSTYS